MLNDTRQRPILAALLLTALGATPVTLEAQDALPAAFIGNWRGVVADQRDGGDLYDTIVKLNNGRVGERVGTTDYPDYDCGGDLYLVSSRGWQIVVREQLTYGTTNCIDNGRIKLTRPNDNPEIMFEWSGSGVEGVGVLERQRN